jgi:hypothetical protein
VTYLGDDRDILVRAAIGFIEWCCWKCGASGHGFMPEEHASGACEVSKTALIAAPVGFVDGGGI